MKNLRLKILEEIYKPNNRGYNIKYYTCECSCGTVKDIKAWDYNRNIFSCGCLQKEIISNKIPYNKLPRKDAIVNIIYKNYFDRAGDKKIEFSLSKEDFKVLLFNNCYYCNTEPKQITRDKYNKTEEKIVHNGIDRKDPKVGYNLSNCVTCCKTCNYGKRNLSESEWLEHLTNLVNFRKTL